MHDIFFSFHFIEAGIFDGLLGAESFEIIIFHDFCADKSFFKICMDYARSLGMLWQNFMY
jgi:hypothetical protein